MEAKQKVHCICKACKEKNKQQQYNSSITDHSPRAYLARARARLYPLCAVTWATKRFHGDMHTCSASGLTEATHEPKVSVLV